METQQTQQAQWQDKIIIQCAIENLSYVDRLRIFFGYPIQVTSEIVTENVVGNCQGVTVIKAISPFELKTYKAV